MSWNRSKWNQFVSDNTKVPPTDAAAKEAAEEAKTLAESHEEDIDLESLGWTRIKRMLEDLAASTPGPTGPKGDDGSDPSSILYTITSEQAVHSAGATTTRDIDLYTFAADMLDGSKGLLKIDLNYENLFDFGLFWDYNAVGGSTSKQILSTAGPVTDGYVAIWIMEVPDYTQSYAPVVSWIITQGNVVVSAYNTLTPPGNQSWMANGGTLRFRYSNENGLASGIRISLQRATL